MDKKSKYASFSRAQLPDTSGLESRALPDNDADVARVLEHVSSPYRWGLPEASPAKPISSVADKYHHQKLRLTR
jgi:hypothetical protein